MKRLLFVLLALTGCAVQSSPTLPRGGAMTYPRTTIPLAHGGELVHEAGRTCPPNDVSRPLVGGSDGARTYSKWTLFGPGGGSLAEAPSFLSNPAGEGEFADSYRKNDRSQIFESPSGRTIVIVEDRSPTFPRKAYLLLRDTGSRWICRDLGFKSEASPKPSADGPDYGEYPRILEVTDGFIRYSGANGVKRLDLERAE